MGALIVPTLAVPRRLANRVTQPLDVASPVHHTATVDTPWDGPAAVKAMPNDEATLTYCHAWHKPSPGDVKGNYSFPHHKTKGGAANLAGCRNGLSRLDGSDVDDKDGVRAHLQAHLDDGNKADHDHRPPVRAMRRESPEWYAITNHDPGQSAEIMIYDEIGFWGVSAAAFVADLAALDVPQLTVRINSPGGEVYDGIAIYNAIANHPATTTVRIEGLAASAASFIAQAGDKIVIERNAQMMIHDAMGMMIGNAADAREMADILDKISDNIADIYAQRAGGDVADWRARMQAETWYSSGEAVKAGLADEIPAKAEKQSEPEEPLAARWDLSIFTYAGRENAPAPPEDAPKPVRRIDPASVRAALKGAIK